MGSGRRILTLTMFAAALQACGDYDAGAPGEPSPARTPLKVIQTAGDLTAALTEFRALLGEPANGGGVGPQPSGRREIKWDGVGADRLNTDAFPSDGFRGAGLITTSGGSGLRVSDNDFSDINPKYQDQFNSFSPTKTFMSIGSPTMTLDFRRAGTDSVAAVSGVGIVFSDIDRLGSGSIQLFTLDGESLGRYQAPVRSDGAGHSFVGVVFEEPIIGRVVLTSGEAPLGSGIDDLDDGGQADLVVTDDFLFSEPQPGS